MTRYILQVHGWNTCPIVCRRKCDWLRSTYERDGITLIESNRCIVAIPTNNSNPIGVLKYDIHNRTMVSNGTWVSKLYRKNGLASIMWEKAIHTDKPLRIKVYVVSDRGITLIESLKKRHTHIKWLVFENASRKLRVLAA